MSNNRKYLIYKHTNLINNKVYIGQTCQEAKTRWQYGGGYKHNAHFYAAIKKYGWNNFSHEILYIDLTAEQANELEKALIEFYDATNPDKGYNIAIGGASNIIYRTEIEAKQARKQIQHNAYLKMVSDETYAQKLRQKSLNVYYANKANKAYQKARSTSNKQSRSKVKQLRDYLRKLYDSYPVSFTETDCLKAFGFKNNKNYNCNSSKDLQELITIIEERIYEKREN